MVSWLDRVPSNSKSWTFLESTDWDRAVMFDPAGLILRSPLRDGP